MQQYVDLVNRVLREGEPRADRTGVGTLAVFGGRVEFDLRDHDIARRRRTDSAVTEEGHRARR